MKSDWALQEKIVTLLERHISSGATVRRNVHLPVLGSINKRKRQCDVVIVSGAKPRETISIVEVQKRQSKPDINTFNGWVEKMREVGAQHLICVSQTGFPDSVEEKANQIGPTIRLITLKQLTEKRWPLESAFCSPLLDVVRYEKLVGVKMEGQHLFRVDPANPNPKEPPDPHFKMFRLKTGELLSATDVIDWHLFANPKNVGDLPKGQLFTLGVQFDWEWNEGLEVEDFSGTWVPLKSLLLQIKLHIRSEPLDWSVLAYEQRGWGDAAWVLRGRSKIGANIFDVITPLKRISPGQYELGHPTAMGNLDAFFAIGKSGIKAHRYVD